MEQHIVEIIDLQFFERIVVHRDRGLAAPCVGREVRELGGDIILVTRIAAEGDPHSMFRTSFAIGGRRVEVVHAVLDGIVGQPVDHLLVDFVVALSCAAFGNGRQAHASVAEDGNLVFCRRCRAVRHLIRGNGCGAACT